MTRSETAASLATLHSPEAQQEVSSSALRAVMSQFATGVVILTVGGEHIHGMTANAFSSVSLDPPMVLCCISCDAVMHRALTAADRFAASIMAADQEQLARYFADKARPLGRAQFDTVDWFPGPLTGAPILTGAAAWLECIVTDTVRSGDHSIFVSSVIALGRGGGGRALVFFDRGFHQIVSERPDATND